MRSLKEDFSDYRMTELGPLPEEWQVVRLGDLWEQGALWIKNGFPQGGFNEQGRGVPHLRPFNVKESGEISLHQIKYVQPPPDNSPYWLRKGDIIFNNTNSNIHTFNKFFHNTSLIFLNKFINKVRTRFKSLTGCYFTSISP